MIPLSTTVLHGLLICLPFTAFVLVTFWNWPRVWLHSLPPDIQQRAGPKTAEEVRLTRVLLAIFLLLLPGLSILSTVLAVRTFPGDLSFGAALIHLYGIWIIVHAWDLVVIDLPHALLIDPQRPPIPGTEGAHGWGGCAFHVRAFVKAVVMSAIFVVPAAGILSLVS